MYCPDCETALKVLQQSETEIVYRCSKCERKWILAKDKPMRDISYVGQAIQQAREELQCKQS